MKLRFAKLNPTQNMTIIVDTPVPRALHGETAAALMDYAGVFAEQVGYREPPVLPGSRGRLQMMGGEFCGNATMCLSALIAREDGLADGKSCDVPVEISGMDKLLTCRVAREGDGYMCRVDMPLPTEIIDDDDCVIVRLPGIAHAVVECSEPDMLREKAPGMLRRIAARLDEGAVGLMLYAPETSRLLPLVYVRGTGTMVWERGCGSGSAAVGAYCARKAGKHVRVSLVQPGGVITAVSDYDIAPVSLSIEGCVKLVCEGDAYI